LPGDFALAGGRIEGREPVRQVVKVEKSRKSPLTSIGSLSNAGMGLAAASRLRPLNDRHQAGIIGMVFCRLFITQVASF